MQLYTKAVLKRLGWTVVLLIVAECIFLIAVYAGLPQGPTVGSILVAMIVVAFILGRVYGSGLAPRHREGDKSAKSGDASELQKRD